MKTNVLMILSIFFLLLAIAQPQSSENEPENESEQTSTTEAPELGKQIGWLVGSWKGTGSQSGKQFTGTLNVQAQLDGMIFTATRESSGGYKELLTIGYDKGSQKIVATLFNNRSQTGVFVAEIAGTKLILKQVSSLGGYHTQRTFEQMPDGNLSFTIEGGKETLKKLIEMEFKKA